jgi:tetratricopeptide (TPR) repeat protein
VKRPWSELLPLLLLLIATWLVYGQALGHGFLSTWDDPRYVTANEAIRGFSLDHLRQAFTSYYVGNYAPLQIVSYMADYTLWGLRASGFIFTNILLHAMAGLLYYRLLLTLGMARLGAVAAAGIFLLHPVQVESVVWVSQRKNLLAMVFFLLALHAWRRFRQSGGWWYGLCLAAFLAALLSKSVAVVLPLVLLLFDLCLVPAARRGRWLLDKLPFAAVAGLTGLLAFYSQSAEFQGGRMGYLGDSPWLQLLTMLPVFAHYLGLLLWPARLSAIYQPPLKLAMDGEVAAAALLLGLAALGGWLLWRRRRESFFWYALFFVGLLPVSHIVPLATLMNDRYLYFPMLGAAGLAGATLGPLAAGRRLPASLVTGAVLLALGLAAAARVPVWRDSVTLWRDTVTKVPGSKEAWLFLAETIYLDQRNPQGALGPYQKALDIDATYPFAMNSVGVYGETGAFLREHLQRREAARRNPRDPAAQVAVALTYAEAGNWPEAERLYARGAAIGGEELLDRDPSLRAYRGTPLYLELAARFRRRAGSR